MTVTRTRLASQLTGSGGALTTKQWRHERKHDASFRGFFRFIAFVSSVWVISLKFMWGCQPKRLNNHLIAPKSLVLNEFEDFYAAIK